MVVWKVVGHRVALLAVVVVGPLLVDDGAELFGGEDLGVDLSPRLGPRLAHLVLALLHPRHLLGSRLLEVPP